MKMSDTTAEAPAVSAGHFSFRPLQAADLPMLHGWLARPHWTEWWGEAPMVCERTG